MNLDEQKDISYLCTSAVKVSILEVARQIIKSVSQYTWC